MALKFNLLPKEKAQKSQWLTNEEYPAVIVVGTIVFVFFCWVIGEWEWLKGMKPFLRHAVLLLLNYFSMLTVLFAIRFFKKSKR